jgi:hypothetical protein
VVSSYKPLYYDYEDSSPAPPLVSSIEGLIAASNDYPPPPPPRPSAAQPRQPSASQPAYPSHPSLIKMEAKSPAPSAASGYDMSVPQNTLEAVTLNEIRETMEDNLLLTPVEAYYDQDSAAAGGDGTDAENYFEYWDSPDDSPSSSGDSPPNPQPAYNHLVIPASKDVPSTEAGSPPEPQPPSSPPAPPAPTEPSSIRKGGNIKRGAGQAPVVQQGPQTPDIWQMFNAEWGQRVRRRSGRR